MIKQYFDNVVCASASQILHFRDEMEQNPRICGRSKRYCVLCSHYGGEVLPDGSVVKVHSIPKEPTRKTGAN